MSLRRLVFLGPEGGRVLRHEGKPLSAGKELPLVRTRSPWRDDHDVERVIVGSHPDRADLRLEGDGIAPEHVRLYCPKAAGAPADLLAMPPGPTLVSGAPVAPGEWKRLSGGEELELGSWRFRYEEFEAP